jgi:hypothetical protein
MSIERTRIAAITVAMIAGSVAALGQGPSPELKAKLEARGKALQSWSTDAMIVEAVKAHNAGLPPEFKAMTNEKWKSLSVLDPFVRSFTRNPLGLYLKGKQDAAISECFVSGADGTKVAFLAKTTSWSHADKDKHKVPMTGKVWFGPVEVDESTGLQQVQIGVPVLDGGKAIGSVVVGLSVAKLK